MDVISSGQRQTKDTVICFFFCGFQKKQLFFLKFVLCISLYLTHSLTQVHTVVLSKLFHILPQYKDSIYGKKAKLKAKQYDSSVILSKALNKVKTSNIVFSFISKSQTVNSH